MLKRRQLEDSPFNVQVTPLTSLDNEISGSRERPIAHQQNLSMMRDDRTATTSAVNIANTEALRIDSICDISTIKLLIDDYFNYIHPVIPLPHEPTFRAAFAKREDRVDRRFAALIAAMIEVLVASFPRRPRKLFTSDHLRRRYPSAGALIDRCHQLFNEARGIGFTDRDPTLDDALSSYLVGLSAGYVFDMVRQRRYLGECVTMLRILGVHSSERKPPGSPSSADTSGTQDYIQQQSGRRLFWLCFVGTMSVRQLGGYDSDVLMPLSSPAEVMPLLPIETDDEYIYPFTILEQPATTVSSLTGFNLNIRIFQVFHSFTRMELHVGRDSVYDRDELRVSIRSSLADVKTIMDNAPKELQLVQNSYYNHWQEQEIQNGNCVDYSPRAVDPSVNAIESEYLPEGDSFQGVSYSKYEIQKANIYATQLATRSYLVEKFWNIYEIPDRQPIRSVFASLITSANSLEGVADVPGANQNNELEHGGGIVDDNLLIGPLERAMALEREAIVRDMVLLVKNISRVNMEPNGISICNKIRTVAATLLQQNQHQKSKMPRLNPDSVNDYLVAFCDILSKLERLGPGKIRAYDGSPGGSHPTRRTSLTAQEVEDEELVCWASLKEHQKRFIERNGWITNI